MPPTHVVTKVVPISTKSQNCDVWTGEQCVAEFLADIKAGNAKPVKLMILYFEENPDGSLKPRRWYAKIDKKEEISLLVLAQHMAVEDWRNP